MNLTKLEEVLSEQPSFRIKSVRQLIFKNLIEDWSGAASLPLSIRQKLNDLCPLKIKAETFPSRDGQTIKALITLADGLKIESVLMSPFGGRFTVCISSQVGCSLQCNFCATGKMGFKRNLSVMEIVEQVVLFSRYLKKINRKVTNVVFMGMGEPFLNFDNVLSAIRVLNDDNGLGIGSRHISVSTSGIVPGIVKFTQQDLQVNLAVSLHAPTDELRSRLMPITATYPLETLFESLEEYIRKTNRKVMFEYLMLEGVNDTEENAYQLIDLLKTLPKPLYMVNLIRYNATGVFKPSNEAVIKKFKDLLAEAEIETTRRYSFGEDIEAACGQLSASSSEKLS